MRKRAIHSFNYPMLTPWLPVAVAMWELAVNAPQVMAFRGARMLAAGPLPGVRDQREMMRMFGEKGEAFAESIIAMSFQWMSQNPFFALATMGFRGWGLPWLPSVGRRPSGDLPRLMATGLAPVRRRVNANVARLRRRSR